jgi:transcription antitermination factor NusA-like protein
VTVQTILSDLGLESPLVGTTVTAHIRSSGPDGFRCAVYDVATGEARDALLPRADAFDLPEGAAPPELAPGSKVIALVVGVAAGADPGSERLMLSVTAPELVERLLAGFVDELLNGKVVIKAIARVAGTKTKIAVAPTVTGVDARGACIGRGASRLKGAQNLLNRGYGRERLEIIEYAKDPAAFLVNAMNPVQVTDALAERGNAIVAVEEHQLSGGIGEGGLNAQLAGRLTGHYVRVVKTGTDLREALDQLVADKAAAEKA